MKYFTTLDELNNIIDRDKPLFVDLETYNDSEQYKKKLYGKVRLAMFCQEGWNASAIVELKFGRDADQIEKLRDLIWDNHIIGQGFYYDFATMQDHAGSYREPNLLKYDDTLYRVRDLFPEINIDDFDGRYSLDKIYKGVLGFDPYDKAGLKKGKLQRSYWGGVLSEDMINYAAIDVLYLPQLWKAIMQREQEYLAKCNEVQTQAYHTRQYLSKHSVKAGLLMQDAGLYLNYDVVEDYINTQKQREKLARDRSNLHGINVNPSNQLKEVMKNRPTNALELSTMIYKEGSTLALDIMECRQAINRIGTVEKWIKLMAKNGRIDGHFNPATTTGRFSSSQENLQNQPRDSKHLLSAPEGAVMLGFDYAQIELRTMCALSGDENMYHIFKTYGDVHKATQDTCGVKERVVAKRVNFGFLYGMGVTKFSEILLLDGIIISDAELSDIKNKFQNIMFPEIPKYHQEGIRKSKMLEPNLSLMGHPYLSKFFNQMNNMANQASGTGEVAKMLFYLADEVGLIDSPVCRLALQVHDSNTFYYWGKAEYIETYCYALGILAQKAWYNVLGFGYAQGITKFNDIPMPVEVGMSDNWKGVDDNIVSEFKGNEYMNDPAGMDKWLEEFSSFHKQQTIY